MRSGFALLLVGVARFVVGCSDLLTEMRGGRYGTFVIYVLSYSMAPVWVMVYTWCLPA